MLDGEPLRDIINGLRENITFVSAYTHILQLNLAQTYSCDQCSEISRRGADSGSGTGNIGGGGLGPVKGDGTVDHSKVEFPTTLKNKLIVWYSFDEEVWEPCNLNACAYRIILQEIYVCHPRTYNACSERRRHSLRLVSWR